jgi:tellurium resistance protein TerZ
MSVINLEKGQKINLKKADGTGLTKVFMGLGWDAAEGTGLLRKLFNNGGGGESIDLDASCAMFDESKNLIDTISFRQLRSRDGSIRHSGDNLTGDGDGDDEVIYVDLTKVAANVKTLVFTVNSFRGQTFDKVKNCTARLVDESTNTEIAKYTPSEKGSSNTGLIMAKVYRHNGEWKMAAIGAQCNGSTIQSIMSDIINHL